MSYTTMPDNWPQWAKLQYAERHGAEHAPSIHLGPNLARPYDPEPQSAPSASGLAVRSLSGAKAQAAGVQGGQGRAAKRRIRKAMEAA